MAKTVKINMYKFVDVEKQSASAGVGGQAESENKLVSLLISIQWLSIILVVY